MAIFGELFLGFFFFFGGKGVLTEYSFFGFFFKKNYLFIGKMAKVLHKRISRIFLRFLL